MGCCRHLPVGSIKTARGNLPRILIVPVRLTALAGFVAGMIYLVLKLHELVLLDFFLLAVSLAGICALLNECRRSECYYKAIEEEEK